MVFQNRSPLSSQVSGTGINHIPSHQHLSHAFGFHGGRQLSLPLTLTADLQGAWRNVLTARLTVWAPFGRMVRGCQLMNDSPKQVKTKPLLADPVPSCIIIFTLQKTLFADKG